MLDDLKIVLLVVGGRKRRELSDQESFVEGSAERRGSWKIKFVQLSCGEIKDNIVVVVKEW